MNDTWECDVCRTLNECSATVCCICGHSYELEAEQLVFRCADCDHHEAYERGMLPLLCPACGGQQLMTEKVRRAVRELAITVLTVRGTPCIVVPAPGGALFSSTFSSIAALGNCKCHFETDEEGHWYVRDDGTPEGVFLSAQRLRPGKARRLVFPAQLRIGELVFKLEEKEMIA